MSDITLKCPKCSATFVVSEFANVDHMTCHSCGSTFQPADIGSTDGKHKLALRKTQTPAPPPLPNEPRGEKRPSPRARRASARGRVVHPGLYRVLGSWLIFAALFALMAFLRYGGMTPRLVLEYMPRVAPAICVVLHILIVLKAVQDSIFQGVLCLLVPFYSLYYVLMVSDAFYLRAITAGLAPAIAQDGFVFFQRFALSSSALIHSWINGGGT